MITPVNIAEKAKYYIEKFNRTDEELYYGDIKNDQAEQWLLNNIPIFDFPDRNIEEIYYFRWWTYRKHIKTTPYGTIITEFMPDVPWAGPYNSINCAAGFHIREGRWLRNSRDIIKSYIRFWTDGIGDEHSYSCWIPWAIMEYCKVTQEYEFGISLLPWMEKDFMWWKENHLDPCGLYWSDDDRDAMEFSISGPGYRPTLNSYMYGNAMAIFYFCKLIGDNDKAERYKKEAETIKNRIQTLLWQNDFFYSIHSEKRNFIQISKVNNDKLTNYHAREEIGFIPWYFDIPDRKYASAFTFLLDPEAFLGKKGITTAEKNNIRYRYPADHECLWNGPSWPFATTQTLVGVSNLLHRCVQEYISKDNYAFLFQQYARQHYRKTDDEIILPWIDENIDPDTGEWISRTILKQAGWPTYKGGKERGKDYNHSMFCDPVITGLLGIRFVNDKLISDPRLLPEWDYFMLDKLQIGDKLYQIAYDKNGMRYGMGSGIKIKIY